MSNTITSVILTINVGSSGRKFSDNTEPYGRT